MNRQKKARDENFASRADARVSARRCDIDVDLRFGLDKEGEREKGN